MASWFTPYKLDWHKDTPNPARISRAVSSRPANWTTPHRMLSTARALGALANVTRDPQTRTLARADSRKLYALYSQFGKKGG